MRGVPEVFLVVHTTTSALRYIPDVSEYAEVCANGTFDGTQLKLSPLLVLLCMPVQHALLLFGVLLLLLPVFCCSCWYTLRHLRCKAACRSNIVPT